MNVTYVMIVIYVISTQLLYDCDVRNYYMNVTYVIIKVIVTYVIIKVIVTYVIIKVIVIYVITIWLICDVRN